VTNVIRIHIRTFVTRHISMKFIHSFLFFCLIFSLTSAQIVPETPPNAPAKVTRSGDSIFFTYQGRRIFKAGISGGAGNFYLNERSFEKDGKVEMVVAIGRFDFKPFDLAGVVEGSDQAFACESEPKDGLKVVRHVAGESNSLRNNAIYDRHSDWLISVDNFYPVTKIITASQKSGRKEFDLVSRGWEIIIRFRPRYYQQHRSLPYYQPWTYNVWKKPVVGWCSWFAYFDKIDEQKIKASTDALSDRLKPYGLEYLQIDDGYQQVPVGLPSTWLQANTKFPSGLSGLSGYIRDKGLTPAIWTNVSFADSVNAFKNKKLFVLNSKGEPAKGNWLGYAMDGSNPEAIRQLISPVYKGLVESGWQYFKLDALRHLRYEGYNTFKDYFDTKRKDRTEAFRNVVKAVRAEIGQDRFLMGGWGIRPELTGIIDACRIGNDGYSYAGLAQFNSYNNVVWLNDPDHIELSEKEAYRSCVATSLTGSLFMVTDKPEVYASPLIEAAQRSIPVLHTLPGQVYDVDPSRSALVGNADFELSGSGPRSFDASTTTTTGLFTLEIGKAFENWLVLGRLDERDAAIPFKDLGLDDKKEYLIFEFWTKRIVGTFSNSFQPGPISSKYNCQVFAIRELQAVPQFVASNRHISCGGLELKDLQWAGNILSGTSELVRGDEYIIYLHEPSNFHLASVTQSNAVLLRNEREGAMRKITFLSKEGGEVKWNVSYQ
jgi:alpha-galactosidase